LISKQQHFILLLLLLYIL